MLGIRMEELKVPLWKKIILGICMVESIATLLIPFYFMMDESTKTNPGFAYWFPVLPMIAGVVLSFSYLKALKGIGSFGQAFKMSLKPVIPFVVSIPLFFILGFCLPSINPNAVIYGLIAYGCIFGGLGIPVFLEIMLIFYFCFDREKIMKETAEPVPQYETIQDNVNEVKPPFKVNKVGVFVCMIVTMLMGVWPYFPYAREVAINEAYGYENLDSFNLIGEFLAKLNLSLILAIPLALVYLRCLKGIKKEGRALLIALVPFLPWIIVEGIAGVISFGFFILGQLLTIPPFLLHIIMTAVCVRYCSWTGRDQSGSPVVAWVGYAITTALCVCVIYVKCTSRI